MVETVGAGFGERFVTAASPGTITSYISNEHYDSHEEYLLPDGWVLVPGVIDVTVDYIEPPEVVADRIGTFAAAVGDPTRILAGADCGLGTFAGFGAVHPEIAREKLGSLAERAALATDRLF